MRVTRLAFAAVVVAALLVGMPTVVAASGTTPTLTLQPYCPVIGGVRNYGAQASVSGFPPNTTFQGSLFIDGGGGTGTFVTDPSGSFGPIGISTAAPVHQAVATVTWSGGTLTKTITNPCQAPPTPTSKNDCKDGGWRRLADEQGQAFRNQGQCVDWAVHHVS